MTPEFKSLHRSPDIETQTEMDKIGVEVLNLVVDAIREDERQKRVRFNFSLAVIVGLLLLCGYLLVTSPVIGIPVSLSAAVILYALRSSFSGIRQKPDNDLVERLKSRIRGSADEKLERWLTPQLAEKRSSERHIGGKTDVSIR